MINRLDTIVLGLLRGRPRTGYDVREWLDVHGRAVGYSAPTSQIYRQLARMAERGWAYSMPDPRASGPDAKLYVLTDPGRAVFDEWACSSYQPVERPMDPDFHVRVQFSRHLGPVAILELVRTELHYRRAQHERPVPYDPSLVPAEAGPEERAWAREIYLLMNQRGRLLVSTFITWLETTEDRLVYLVESSRRAPKTTALSGGDAAGPDNAVPEAGCGDPPRCDRSTRTR
jgi:DNA-binding PadR family transcriptional regulator